MKQIKKIHNIPADVDVAFSTQFQLHQMASIRGAEEIERIKARLDQIYIAKDFARIRTAIIQFKSNPSVTCNFVYVPDYDFEGNSLQSFTDFNNDLSHLCVTILPTNTGGFAIFSHLDTANSAPRKLIESLFLQKDITSSLVWLIACQTENFALSPVWYEGLLQNQKDAFMSAFHSNTDIFEPVINQLKNRKLTVASWNPENRFFCKCQLIFWLA